MFSKQIKRLFGKLKSTQTPVKQGRTFPVVEKYRPPRKVRTTRMEPTGLKLQLAPIPVRVRRGR